MQPDEPLLTTADVAARLQVKVPTVRDWLRRGDLAGAKLPGPNGGWRIRPADLEAFLAAPETTGAP